MKELLRRYIKDKKVLILGFGREGRSTFRLLQYFFSPLLRSIADRNPGLPLTEVENEKVSELFLGKDYLNALGWADIVFKSPGINLGKTLIVQSNKKNRLTNLPFS